MTLVEDLIHDIGGIPPTHTVHTFTASRFPYTYAYDYVRMCRPVGCVELSRAEASGIVKAWCERRGLDRDAVVYALAWRYLDHYGIVPASVTAVTHSNPSDL